MAAQQKGLSLSKWATEGVILGGFNGYEKKAKSGAYLRGDLIGKKKTSIREPEMARNQGFTGKEGTQAGLPINIRNR